MLKFFSASDGQVASELFFFSSGLRVVSLLLGVTPEPNGDTKTCCDHEKQGEAEFLSSLEGCCADGGLLSSTFLNLIVVPLLFAAQGANVRDGQSDA